ncbi:MAG: M48 family metallopeptidase [Pikeienuella sp.]
MLRVILIPIIVAGVIAYIRSIFARQAMYKDLEVNSDLIDDPELEAVIRRIGRQVGIDHLTARLYKQDVVNGMAVPDGRIFITTGLFERYQRGEFTSQEIGSVIAHELGHVARGHAKQRMRDITGGSAANVALAMVLNRFIPFVGIYLANMITGAYMSKISRKNEFEADEYASALMISAGIGVDPQISMFEKLEARAPGGRGIAWLSSHPMPEERIKVIRANHQKWDLAKRG